VNAAVGRVQHGIRIVHPMSWLPHLLRTLGAAGAVDNARAELTSAESTAAQADLVVRRVNAARNDAPLVSVQAARVA
jgi:hypothetical protein